MDHVRQTTFAGVRADVASAVDHLRGGSESKLFVMGFCFGGSNAWHMAAEGFGLAGVIGFYGHPDRDFPPGSGSVIGKVDRMDCPVLGLMGGDDPGIPVDLVDRFRAALAGVGADHEVVVYPAAPHSFFDRKQADFATESADAWERVLAFLER
jgi:carboxymethylenebutenolidase